MRRSDFGVVMLSSLLATLTTYVACVEHPAGDPEVQELSRREDLPPYSEKVIGIERAFAEISEQVPEFAGFHFDDAGNLVVSLTDLGKSEQARAHTDGIAASRARAGMASPTVFRAVSHTFGELRAWRDALVRAIGRNGLRPAVRFIDLDEADNRIVVGIMEYAVRAQINGLAADLGIPGTAVATERGSRFTPDNVPGRHLAIADVTHQNLSTRRDTVTGGLLVKTNSTDACSAWVGARQGADSIILTASHCGEWAELEASGELFQRNTSAGDKIGEEMKDPTSTCSYSWPADGCRWADASMYEVTDLDRFTQGRVTQTANSSGSVQIEHDSIITIWDKTLYPVVGDTVHKVGFETGWTKGRVEKTCRLMLNWPPDASDDYDLKCQDFARYGRANGDSGAPVFLDVDGNWEIIGIHAGGFEPDTAVFSAIDNIQQDLGTIVANGVPFTENRVPRAPRVRSSGR